MDLKKAFDSVDKEKVLDILNSRCKTEDERHIFSLIESLHKTSTLEIGQLSFPAEMGVVQGSVLSPQLFNLYLEAALEDNLTLREKYRHGGILAYADDLVCTFSTQEEAARIIKALGSLEGKWGLALNKQKSLILADIEG